MTTALLREILELSVLERLHLNAFARVTNHFYHFPKSRPKNAAARDKHVTQFHNLWNASKEAEAQYLATVDLFSKKVSEYYKANGNLPLLAASLFTIKVDQEAFVNHVLRTHAESRQQACGQRKRKNEEVN